MSAFFLYDFFMDVVSVVISQHMNAKFGSSDLRNISNRRAAASFMASLKCPRSGGWLLP